MHEGIKVTGKIEIFEDDKKVYETNNLVVNTGLALIADLLKGVGNVLSHVAIGDDDTAPAAGQTALLSEQIRRPATDLTATGNQLVVTLNLAASEAVFTWKEVGLFNASSGGIMFNRANVDYAKGSGNTATLKITLTFTV